MIVSKPSIVAIGYESRSPNSKSKKKVGVSKTIFSKEQILFSACPINAVLLQVPVHHLLGTLFVSTNLWLVLKLFGHF